MAVVYKVPQNHVVLVKRFGKNARIQHSGLRFKLPLIERITQVENWEGIASRDGFLIALSEQHTSTPRKEFQTLENITVHADLSLWWRIEDPLKAIQGTEVLPSSISYIGIKTLRSIIGEVYLRQVLSERRELDKRISEKLADTFQNWGVTLIRVETYCKCDLLDKSQNFKSPSKKVLDN